MRAFQSARSEGARDDLSALQKPLESRSMTWVWVKHWYQR